MKILKQKNTLEKFMTNAETYLEPRQIFKLELLGWTIFAKKFHHRFSIGFQTRLVNEKRYLKIAFSKIPKISQEKTVLEYCFSKVVGLSCKFKIKLQSTAEVFFWIFLDFLREVFFEAPLKNSSWAYWKRTSGSVLEKKIKFVEPIHVPALF